MRSFLLTLGVFAIFCVSMFVAYMIFSILSGIAMMISFAAMIFILLWVIIHWGIKR